MVRWSRSAILRLSVSVTVAVYVISLCDVLACTPAPLVVPPPLPPAPVRLQSLTPFGKGNFKRAYWATIEEDMYLGHKKGTTVVLKTMHPHMREKGCKAFEEDVKAQKMASKLCKKFNERIKPKKFGEPCNVYMRIGRVGTFDRDWKKSNGTVILQDQEAFCVELPIPGKFEKFNSNNGWSSGRGTLADTFSHWTWAYTNGDMLVCDVQGHRGEANGRKYKGHTFYYLLTDPAICSTKKVFGGSDLGEKGMADWFRCHKCNSFCKRLGLDMRRAAPLSKVATPPDDGLRATKSSSAWRHTRKDDQEED